MFSYPVFILSHGRAERVKTVKALKRGNYEGDWYIVIDDEDDQADDYMELYPGHVLQFRKAEAIKRTQTVAPTSDRSHNVVVYARNELFDIAAKMGAEYFVELDDDYDYFNERYQSPTGLSNYRIRSLDDCFELMREFVEKAGFDCLAMAQDGDYIGGLSRSMARPFKRKVYNVYLWRTSSTCRFTGVLNEDLSLSVMEGMRGAKLATANKLSVHQQQTQRFEGGLTEEYKRHGTYAKSMYSVVQAPSCVSLQELSTTHKRWHHKVEWRYAVPRILPGSYGRG